MSLTLTDDEASVVYWAMEHLDAEEGLEDDERPVFEKVAEHVGQPYGGEA